MRIINWLVVALSAPAVMAHDSSKKHHSSAADALVYELNNRVLEVDHVDSREALLYLADKYNVGDNLALGSGEQARHAMEFISHQRSLRGGQDKPKMFITIDGTNWNSVRNDTSFTISKAKPLKLTKQLTKNFLHSGDYKKIKLTEEMNLLSKEGNSDLSNHFKIFNDKLVSIWNSFTRSQANGDQQIILNEESSVLRLINDRFFINELSQLIHLNSVDSLLSSDVLMLHIHSLLSIGKKTGFDSLTYKISNKVLSSYLSKLAEKFEITLLTSNNQFEQSESLKKIDKRSLQLQDIFAKTDLNSKSGGCFLSEESCQDVTNLCSGHGKCIKSKVSDCWSCACAATYNKTSQRTSYWAGGDCSKQDISSQANLLLWTGVALVVLFIAGVQLLYTVGNEPLPGVLDAATMPKKND